MASLSKWLKNKRLKNDEVLHDMAQKLDVKTSTLSAIENQRQYADARIFAILLHEYTATPEEALELGEAFDEHVSLELVPREEPKGVCYVSVAHTDENDCACNECRITRMVDNDNYG